VKLINSIQGDGILVIQVQDDNLDASNVREFRDEMQKLIKDNNRVILDMLNLRVLLCKLRRARFSLANCGSRTLPAFRASTP
jgi:hypothetical protein